MWQESLNVVLQHYQPTPSLISCTDTMSTEELAQTLERHTGAVIDRAILYAEMHNRGYHADIVNENELHWLMVRVGTVLVLSDGRT
jgi:hypothetical protein